ncbi:hypothetical protein [Cytobacillus purgationiresistens]|uniref:Uncharacterized protein n=1 Tax=Cytobacillus purgationiresistens TaxID=863449 RepID=A0ABU0AJH1_9BACI|nr:hypothetical protein [Cytobacillus purgationiresistens]MDQ0270558.1 hypothetical protein [Cytobacillus purgationiresistens]
MKKAICLFGLVIIIGFVAYSESPDSFVRHNHEPDNMYSMIPVVNDLKDVEEVDQAADKDPLAGIIPTLELKLVDTQIESDQIIEKYRQYEVYRGKDNQVLESVALDHYEYLKYDK